MTSLLHYWLASSGDLSLLFLTLLTVVNWQHLELGKRSRWLCRILYYVLHAGCIRDRSGVFHPFFALVPFRLAFQK